VKQFGKRMATDHQKAYDELEQLASQKGVPVPRRFAASEVTVGARPQDAGFFFSR
jgi:predicted outer membrane protein